jgi:bacterioferritin
MDNNALIDALIAAYNAEIETVANYLANSVNLDGVRAKHIKQALEADIQEELGHATLVAKRIKTIGGMVPGSQRLKMIQTTLQPPTDTINVIAVIKGVIDAEDGAIAGYQRIIELADKAKDYVTQDLATTLMGDEQEHRREFVGFLKEYEASL